MNISLCMVVSEEADNLKELFPLLKEKVKEIIIVDQDSKDSTGEICKDFGARYFKRSKKNLADIDRQFCYNLAGSEWILSLDADERPSEKLLDSLEKYTQNPNVHCYWFRFDNQVDGIDISPVLGQEYHPRLWRKGFVQWPERAHTWPSFANGQQAFLDTQIHHHRTLERIESVHAKRRLAIDPQNQQVEHNFLHNLKQFLKSRGSIGI